LKIDGAAARVDENRDRAWVLDGEASVRMVLAGGATASLTYDHPLVATLRGRYLGMSACLASPTDRPVAATVTVLQAGGYNILTSHTYHGRGRWECFRRVFLVGEHAGTVELTLAVSSPGGAEVYLDRLELRAFPVAGAAREVSATLLDRGNPNRLRLQVEAPEDGFLVRKENYHSGWSAVVDGRPVPIERYGGVFQAVALARGAHTVEFTFRSIYPVLMWAHVVAVLLGYVGFYGYLIGAVTDRPATADRTAP
jgi:hypothetical protein